MIKKSIPNWTIDIDEISNGVFKVTLKDAFGSKVEITDNNLDLTIERATSDAFDIERKVSKNWNLFLYELALHELANKDIRSKKFNYEVFGSWYIEVNDKRLVYDGKDSWLMVQVKTKNNWTDIETVKNEDLQYPNFVRLLHQV